MQKTKIEKIHQPINSNKSIQIHFHLFLEEYLNISKFYIDTYDSIKGKTMHERKELYQEQASV
jgi:hypothetical protein